MRYHSLEDRDVSYWLKRYPHCLTLNAGDQERLVKDDAVYKILPYSIHQLVCFDDERITHRFDRYDLAQFKRRTSNSSGMWTLYEYYEPPYAFFKTENSKLESECKLKLYFKTKDDALMFKLRWG